jgi:hypothetical protein
LNGTSHALFNFDAGTAAEETPAADATAANAAVAPEVLPIQGAATAATFDNAGLGMPASDPAAEPLDAVVGTNKATADTYWPKLAKLTAKLSRDKKKVGLAWQAIYGVKGAKYTKSFQVERAITNTPKLPTEFLVLDTVKAMPTKTKYMYVDTLPEDAVAGKFCFYRVRGCVKESNEVRCSDKYTPTSVRL